MLTDGPIYQQAKALAMSRQRPYYVNSHGYGANEYLLVEAGRGRRCCAVAQRTGEIELVVQDQFAEVTRVGR
jgi:hypothetical protein